MGNGDSSNTPREDDDGDLAAIDASWVDAESPDDEQVTTLLFTATNPPGTVSATALMDGRILSIELSPQVNQMTEFELAQEITLIAELARRQAQAAQHAMAANVMRQLGHDDASTRSFLERELGLPSPQTVLAEKSHVFATRYAEERD